MEWHSICACIIHIYVYIHICAYALSFHTYVCRAIQVRLPVRDPSSLSSPWGTAPER